MRSDGLVIVSTGTTNNPVACGSANASWLVFNPATENGKALLAILQSALLIGRKLNITGTGSCPASVPFENVSTVNVFG
jgi:hypothetical protein